MKRHLPHLFLGCSAIVLALGLTLRPKTAVGTTVGGPTGSGPTGNDVRRDFVRTASMADQGIPDPKWHWSMIESEDYRKYVANLRSIRCPEQTLRDIVIADVNKLYAPREAPFKEVTAGGQPWETTSTRSRTSDTKALKEAYERRRKLREIELEKAAIIKELTGYTLPLTPLRGWSSQAYDRHELALNGVPPEKRERVRELLEQHWIFGDSMAEKYGSKRTPEYYAEYKRLQEQRRESMLTVLSADELEDFEMRASRTATRLGTQLQGLHLTEEEFKAIYRAHAEIEEPYGGTIPLSEFQGMQPEEMTRRQAEAAETLKTTLGEDRYATYEKGQDGNWQLLGKLKNRFELSDEVIEKAFDLQKGFGTIGINDAELGKEFNSLQQELSTALSAGNSAQVQEIQQRLMTQQTALQERQNQIAVEHQKIMDQITALLGEKAGKIFAARNQGSIAMARDTALRFAPGTGTDVRRVIQTLPPPAPTP